jgi:hypothetical protein
VLRGVQNVKGQRRRPALKKQVCDALPSRCIALVGLLQVVQSMSLLFGIVVVVDDLFGGRLHRNKQWDLVEAKKGKVAAQYRRRARTFWRVASLGRSCDVACDSQRSSGNGGH